MHGLEHLLTNLADIDLHWWPFQFLRPRPDQRLGNRRVAALSLLVGGFVGMLMNIVAALHGESPHVALLPALTALGFFVVFRFTVAVCWNRRAARLRNTR